MATSRPATTSHKITNSGLGLSRFAFQRTAPALGSWQKRVSWPYRSAGLSEREICLAAGVWVLNLIRPGSNQRSRNRAGGAGGCSLGEAGVAKRAPILRRCHLILSRRSSLLGHWATASTQRWLIWSTTASPPGSAPGQSTLMCRSTGLEVNPGWPWPTMAAE